MLLIVKTNASWVSCHSTLKVSREEERARVVLTKEAVCVEVCELRGRLMRFY